MIENYTLARPYAKAIFAAALKARNFQQWSDFLTIGKKILEAFKHAHSLITVGMSRKQRLELARSVSQQFIFPPQENFIRLLIKRRKLYLLPEIAELYQRLWQAYEKKLTINIQTAMALTAEQHEKLTLVLQNKLGLNITLLVTVNLDLIGGAIIYMGDRVVDGSIAGMLSKF